MWAGVKSIDKWSQNNNARTNIFKKCIFIFHSIKKVHNMIIKIEFVIYKTFNTHSGNWYRTLVSIEHWYYSHVFLSESYGSGLLSSPRLVTLCS